jgi:hypothetical protein
MGIDRLKEALEANDWEGDNLEAAIDPDGLEGGDDSDGEGSLGFGIDRDEMEEEMKGMKQAIYDGTISGGEVDQDEAEQDDEVEKLQAMMLKMQAVRGKFLRIFLLVSSNIALDMGADMPEAERKRFAAKAVSEIMKSL